jgi:hypothetical protein
MTYSYSKDKKEETPKCVLYDTLTEAIVSRYTRVDEDPNGMYMVTKHLKSGKFYVMCLGGC